MAKKTKKKVAKKVTKKPANKKSAPKKKTTPAKKAAPVKKAAPKKKAVKKPVKKAATKASATPAPKPEATNSVNPYLTFPGNCEEAFHFYQSVFGGKFPYVGRFKEMPPMEGYPPMPASELEKIMHISLPIGNTILMGSDSSDAFGHTTLAGNNFSISINAKSQPEADRIYKGLSAGGAETMPMSKTFWGSYFGMLTDKYGIQWMLSFDENSGQKM